MVIEPLRLSDQEVDMDIDYKRTVYCDAVHDMSNAILIKLRIHYKKRNIMEMKTLTTIWSVSVPKCYGDTRFFINSVSVLPKFFIN